MNKRTIFYKNRENKRLISKLDWREETNLPYQLACLSDEVIGTRYRYGFFLLRKAIKKLAHRQN